METPMGIATGENEVTAVTSGESADLQAARDAAVVIPLSHFAVLRFSGEDAADFLQNQLTCDIGQVTPIHAQFGGYCTPQGRLLATFLLLWAGDAYRMVLPVELADTIASRLRKYVLRSRVRIEREEALRMLGLGGPQAADAIASAIGPAPRHAMETVLYGNTVLLRLPGDSFLVVAPESDGPQAREKLGALARPASVSTWDWLQVRARVPWITLATQDQFIPQMVGLDTLGGVAFDKGCYPGQEIVARTHYLGQVKRHLRSGHSPAPALPGETLVAASQVRGVIVNAAPAPQGGVDFVAVSQDAAEANLRLRSDMGPGVVLGD